MPRTNAFISDRNAIKPRRPYPAHPDYDALTRLVLEYSRRQHEYGSPGVQGIIDKLAGSLTNTIERLKGLRPSRPLAAKEPDLYREILKLRSKGPRRLWHCMDKGTYKEKLEGAFLGRMAGCTLGSPVEGWEVEKMQRLAEECGVPFPPVNYWPNVHDPLAVRYKICRREDYSLRKMRGVPPDDDIEYTIMGLLIVEEFGKDFTTADVGRAWRKYLPLAYTAEEVVMKNLEKGVPAEKAGGVDNPYCEWIGADIRSDPWAYLAPGRPEKAAEMAYRDARLSHRRQGVYGAMFFAAAISAAFATDNPVQALRIGLTEIPRECALAREIRWALGISPRIKNYKEAREAVDRRFKGMSMTHTISNACLTVFGVTIGDSDLTRTISETVAMGYDNDCTAATAGSIAGASAGRKGVPGHWTRPFHNTVHSYLINRPLFKIDDLVDRFSIQANRILG